MLEKLRTLFRRVDKAATRQQQREAMIDLLVWTMYADHLLTLPENKRLDDVTEMLTRDAALPLRQYVGTSIAKVRDALADPVKAETLMDDVYERLGSKGMRRQAYEACLELAQSDGVVADREKQFLDTLKVKLGLEEA